MPLPSSVSMIINVEASFEKRLITAKMTCYAVTAEQIRQGHISGVVVKQRPTHSELCEIR